MEFALIIKKIKGTLSKEESILFDKWYDESQRHRVYFKKVKENYRRDPGSIDKESAWIRIEKRLGLTMLSTVKQRGVRRGKSRKKYWKFGVAASALLLIALFVFLNNYSNDEESGNMADSELGIESNIEIGSNKAILTLEDGSDVTLEKGNALNRENLSSNGEELVYLKGIGGGINAEGEVKYNTLTIPRGGEFFLQLSDGTKVWLNSDSRIRYPVTFVKGNTRKVELLYGEAYFDVTHAENHKGASFEVISKDQEITVLGTQFNVKAYADEEEIYSTLVEGSIELRYEGQKQLLKPNDQAIIRKGNSGINVQSIDVYNEIAWRKGDFGFEKETLGEIMKVLSRWYDVEIEFENKEIEKVRFTGVFNKRQQIDNILSIISGSNGIDYEINGKTVVLK